MFAAMRLLGGVTLAMCFVPCACNVVSGDPTAGHSPNGMSSAGGEASTEPDAGEITSRAGSGSARMPNAAAGSGGTGAAGDQDSLVDSGVDATNASNGEAGEAGASGNGDPGNSDANCDLDGGCAVSCTGQSADCAVVPVGFACEFDGFVGKTARAECGVNVSVGTACCGGCGCVTVDVFYDGRRCWQGIPECALGQFAGKVFAPHEPSPAPRKG